MLDGDGRQRAYGLLAETYYAVDQVLSKLGHVDLASLAVDRYEWAAERSGDPLAVLVGHYRRAGELISAGIGTQPPDSWSRVGAASKTSSVVRTR